MQSNDEIDKILSKINNDDSSISYNYNQAALEKVVLETLR